MIASQMAHESTVDHNIMEILEPQPQPVFKPVVPQNTPCTCGESRLTPTTTSTASESQLNAKPSRVLMVDRQTSLCSQLAQKQRIKHQSSVPHLFAETPKVVTHHHDTDDEDTDHSDKS